VKSFYDILGVAKTASDDDIKRAYRRLASQHHPDKGGDTAKFQEIQEAYATLGDPARRREYDSPTGMFSQQMPPGFDMNSIFEMFGARFVDPRARPVTARIQLWITLRDVVQGGPRTIAVASPSGQQNLEINLPVGIEDGNSVKYPGLAPGGVDLVITFRVRPEAGWQRQDNHIIRDVTLSIWDLVLGTELKLETLADKTISIMVPPNTQPGTMLRVRGHGIRARNNTVGDFFVRLATRLPSNISKDLLDHIRRERDS